MSALDNLRRVLDQAQSEPDDGIAIRTGVDPTLQWRGLTWGDLRAVIDEAMSAGRLQELDAIHRHLDHYEHANRCAAPIQVTSSTYRYCTMHPGHGPLIDDNGARHDHAIPAAGLWWSEVDR